MIISLTDGREESQSGRPPEPWDLHWKSLLAKMDLMTGLCKASYGSSADLDYKQWSKDVVSHKLLKNYIVAHLKHFTAVTNSTEIASFTLTRRKRKNIPCLWLLKPKEIVTNTEIANN